MRIRQNATPIWRRFSTHPAFTQIKTVCLDVVFPPRCPVCDDVRGPFAGRVCPACRTVLRPLRGACCRKCGKPFGKDGREAGVCPECRRREHAFDRVFSVFEYRSAAPSLYRFKYCGRREYADFYAECFVRRYGGLPEGVPVDVLVPVPLHPAKQRSRGYNQAELLARALSARTGIPVRNDLVYRVKKTGPQKELDYYGRLNNLKNAFIIGKNDVKYNSIALVDDIFTTGTTADGIAALLKRHGAGYVCVFTPAIATNCFS